MSETAKLTRGSVGGHIVTQTMPMVIGVAAMMSVGVIDAYFIGQLGSDELAAVAFIFPIMISIGSLGVGVMVGINSVISRALGEGKVEQAARRANFGIVLATLIGVLMGLGLYLGLDPLFRLMQAPDHLLPLIRDYMQPYALGMPLLIFQMGTNGVLRGQGEARKTSYVSLTYSVANWILDPILITGAFGFEGFGIAGAAYATLAGWAIAIALGVYLLNRTDLPLNPALIRDSNWGESTKAIMAVTGPASFSNAINPIGLSVLTALLASQGEAAVAGFGAAGRLQSFAVVPLLALSGSIGSIVGQNWGAKAFDRAKEALFLSFGFCIIYGLAVAALLVWQADAFAQFFTDDAQVLDEFASYLAISAWGYAGFGLLIVGNGAMNAIGHAGWALAQSCARVFLIMLPVAWLLRASWGADAIYSGELVANLVGGAISAALAWYLIARMPSRTPQAA